MPGERSQPAAAHQPPPTPAGLSAQVACLRAWASRLIEHPGVAQASRRARHAVTLVILVVLIWSVASTGWREIFNGMPTSPLFYLVLLLSYLVQPMGERAVYRALWGKDRHLSVLPFMQKRVYSSTILSYSGEAFLYVWARRHLALPERFIRHSIRDSNILSATAGLLVMFALLATLAAGGVWRLPALSGDYGWDSWGLACLPLLLALGLVFTRRRVTILSHAQILRVFMIHLARSLASHAVQLLLWIVAIPEAPFAAWLNFLVARMLVAHVTFVSSGNLVLLTAGIWIAGELGLPHAQTAAVLLVSATGWQILHFVVMSISPAAGREAPPLPSPAPSS
jgi:hypothetical protein